MSHPHRSSIIIQDQEDVNLTESLTSAAWLGMIDAVKQLLASPEAALIVNQSNTKGSKEEKKKENK